MNIASVNNNSTQTATSNQSLQSLEAKEKHLQAEIKNLQKQESEESQTQIQLLQSQLTRVQQQISEQKQSSGSVATNTPAPVVSVGPAYMVDISQPLSNGNQEQ